MRRKVAIIIGAGPAGLTAAYELLTRTNIQPIVIEKSNLLGGIATTIDYKGYKMDIGGHRFFTKSNRVMKWWFNLFKLEDTHDAKLKIKYQNKESYIFAAKRADPEKEDSLFLVRKRRSRIFYNGNFYKYPIELSIDTFKNLGLRTFVKIILSYLRYLIFPIKPEKNLEDFYINRFGKELYEIFFKTYTEKVWGLSCSKIGSEWGRQRVKGLSIGKVILHFFKKTNETSLIDNFLYPKYGPGQFWNTVSDEIKKMGGKIYLNSKVTKTDISKNKITAIELTKSGKKLKIVGDYFFSTMAISDLIASFYGKVPTDVKKIALDLPYRDFVVVGILLKKTEIPLKDNWIYVHDKKVKVGRIQVFNNWSPYLIKDKKIWLGMEYFCSENDEFWRQSDEDIEHVSLNELITMGFCKKEDFLDAHVVRMNKVYPAYTGSYRQFHTVRKYLDNFTNLFLIGRNGMHKYNNQDHSMLTAMTAVDNIINKREDKSNLWKINTEQEYNEK